MKKVCKLINSSHCWILEVDGQEIPFQLGFSADYFEKHYTELGYKVTREKKFTTPYSNGKLEAYDCPYYNKCKLKDDIGCFKCIHDGRNKKGK